jgi:hypothetical protein
LQQLRQDQPLALILGCREHVVVVRYTPPKPFAIVWQALDNLGLLGKLQGAFGVVPPLPGVQCRAYRSVQPINLGAKLFRGSHGDFLRIGGSLQNINRTYDALTRATNLSLEYLYLMQLSPPVTAASSR